MDLDDFEELLLDKPQDEKWELIGKVVSPSSEERDRGEKASAYMRLTSLKHVCFIDRDRVHIDTFDRNDAGWVPRVPVESLDDTFGLDAIEFSMRVADL